MTTEDREALLARLAAARQHVAELEHALGAGPGADAPDDATFTRTLLSHLPDYVYFKDRERRFLRCSDSFEQLLGRPAAEIIGRRDEELFPPHIAEETAEDDRRVIEQGIPLINKLEGGEVAPGVEHWVLTTKLPWRAPDGRTLGLFGLSRDITAEKKLEDSVRESERRLRIISETVPFPVAATSLKDGTILYANRAFAEFLDIPLERLIGSASPDYYADKAQRAALVERVLAGERVEGEELVMRRHDGSTRIAASSIIPLTIDGKPALMGAGADVTELKETERELREVGAQKDLLLREVNHRVRNNLATLNALIAQQLRNAEGPVREALERIDRSVRGLAAVHAMLSESGWRPIELTTLCRDVVRAMLRGVEPPTTLRVSAAPQRSASQPAHQLALVLAELATNSLKHASGDGPLEIGISIGPSTDEGVCIEYRDNGPGFPEGALAGQARGVGLRLIEGLVGYGLSGRVSFGNDGGAVTTLQLPRLDQTLGPHDAGGGGGTADG